jgi:predicted RNA-binding Zn ribbon-like protein
METAAGPHAALAQGQVVAVERMRIVGGDPALDFVNTRSGPAAGPPELEGLTAYPDLVVWARRVELVTPAEADRLTALSRDDEAAAAAALERAHAVRHTLFRVFDPLARAGAPAPQALAALRAAFLTAVGHAGLEREGAAFAWRWAAGSRLEAPLDVVVGSAVRLLTTGPVSRLKGCAACSFLFLDESRNGSRRWCSMEDCGQQAKIRRILDRRAARRAG